MEEAHTDSSKITGMSLQAITPQAEHQLSLVLESSNSARSLVPVAPPVRRLNVVGMVVAPGSSHASWVDVVRHDVAEVGELHMAERALLVLFDNLAVYQPPHL
jgi:hypothetical protein